jgi:hypothetical protein
MPKVWGKVWGLAAQIGVVAVLGGRTFNLSARKSWRIHLKCPSRPASSGTPRPDRIAGRRNHGRIVVSAAVKHRNALFGSWARPLSSTPALLQNLHLAQVRQRAKCRGPE